MTHDLYALLSQNDYPGRGIVIGRSPDGDRVVLAYWIMGRSPHSRNRLFVATDDGIRTVAANPAKLTDPHLIIYHPVRTVGNTTVVANGDQSDTVCAFLRDGVCHGFEAALATRTFEDDFPNLTPRITGIVDHHTGGFKLSILKSDRGDPHGVLRYTYDYPTPPDGEGRYISTYRENGDPLPSFEGEPIAVSVDTDDGAALARRLWESLNADNRISLFVRTVDRKTGAYEDVIINQYHAV